MIRVPHRLVPLLLLSPLALVTGCDQTGDEPAAIESRITLSPFNSCEQLEAYIEDAAIREMRASFEQSKQGYGGGGWLRGAAEFDSAAPAADANGQKASGPSAYTTTNNQVKGVDEADFTKNDGTRIFVLSGRKLFISRSWPAAESRLVSEVVIEGWPSAMFLDEKDRVVVLSSVYLPIFAIEGRGQADCWDCYGGGNTTKLTVIDVAKLEQPTVIDEFYVPGWYNNARRIKSSVRVVLSDWFRWPAKMKWWPDYQPGIWDDRWRLARELDRLAVENEALIRAQTLAQWLPLAKRRTRDGQLVDVGYKCNEFYMTNAPVKMGLVTVATLNMDDRGAPPTRTSVLAEPGQIYANHEHLYVASNHWWWWPRLNQADYTYVHKFDITDPSVARYVASGGFYGHIVDQFSLDEHNGYFRVASTLSMRVRDEANPMNTWGRIETTNQVFVLAERAGSLQVIGESEQLAKGERIQSSRFQGDKGYVVTFRQVDPLYTFDLTDPTKPRRIGELKVPGFSTYIHPLDKDHLLTMGVYMPEPDGQGRVDWRERRMQLSIFDVSDFANPKLQFAQLVGSAYGWSEAQWEHKAFNYFPERKLLAIPFSDYRYEGIGDYWDYFTSELRVFNVDLVKGITPIGAVSMKDVYRDLGNRWNWYYSPWIRRSVMATDDDKNDFVYAISDSGVRVVDAKDFRSPLATVRFRDPAPR